MANSRSLMVRVVLPLACCGTLASAVLGQGVTDALVLVGDSTPDGTATFIDFSLPKLNNMGQVAFRADLENGTFQKGLFRAEKGVPHVQIARTGDSTGNGVFDAFTLSDLNNAGQVAFTATLSGTSGGIEDNKGFYVGSGNAVTEAARNGQPLALSEPLAGIQDPRFSDLDVLPFGEGPTLNDSGRLSFVSHVEGCEPIIGGCTPVKFEGVFTSSSGVQQILAKEGDAAPLAGGGTSGTFAEFVGPPPSVIDTAVINNSGAVVFRARTIDSNPSTEGLYFARRTFFGTTRRAIARTGLFPVQPEFMDVSGSNAGGVDMNDAGEVAFLARHNLPDDPTDVAIYRWSPEEAAEPGAHGLTQIVRTGQIIPGADGTIAFPTSFPLQMNASGHVAFHSKITSNVGFDDEGIFRGDGQDLELIARFGQQTPDSQLQYRRFLGAAINDVGQIAFQAQLENSSGQFAGDGLFIYDGQDLIEVTRSGRPIAGTTVDRIFFQEENGINESGQVAYLATLADGREGIFLFTLPAAALPGDFNGDGAVDAADYVVWRNDPDAFGGQQGYDDWVANFGQTAGSGSSATQIGQAAVPEPLSRTMLLLGAGLVWLAKRRKVGTRRSTSETA